MVRDGVTPKRLHIVEGDSFNGHCCGNPKCCWSSCLFFGRKIVCSVDPGDVAVGSSDVRESPILRADSA